jgi:hypothetical protein
MAASRGVPGGLLVAEPGSVSDGSMSDGRLTGEGLMWGRGRRNSSCLGGCNTTGDNGVALAGGVVMVGEADALAMTVVNCSGVIGEGTLAGLGIERGLGAFSSFGVCGTVAADDAGTQCAAVSCSSRLSQELESDSDSHEECGEPFCLSSLVPGTSRTRPAEELSRSASARGVAGCQWVLRGVVGISFWARRL